MLLPPRHPCSLESTKHVDSGCLGVFSEGATETETPVMSSHVQMEDLG